MSRGLGALQRRVLAVLEHNPDHITFSLVIAGLAFDTESVSPAQVVATRRALRGLVARGLAAQASGGFRYGQHAWGTPAAVAAYEQRARAVFGGEAASR